MASLRVLVLLALALSAIVCDAATESKRSAKPSTEPKKVEDRTTKGKRDSSEITTIYAVKQKDEPFRPIYQYQYQGAPLRPTHYVAAASSPQIAYNKPDSAIGIGPEASPSDGGSNAGNIQYAAITSYKPQNGIQYAPSPFKAPVNAAANRLQYASSAYRGPFVATYQPASPAEVKVHPIYAPPLPSNHPPPAVSLPLHYGGYEQQLPPSHPPHQHPSVYALAFPADYMRHYQQNLAAPFQMHGTHFVPVLYSPGPAQSPPAFKEPPLKPSPVHFISLGPHSPAAAASAPVASTLPASSPTVITHIIPLYGHGPHHHQHLFQQPPPLPFFFGAHHQQGPAGLAYSAGAPTQQQTIQIAPKHQIFGPIQVGAGASTTIPFIPFKPIVVAPQHQQQQQLQQSHQPSGTTYHRYAPSPSGSSSSGNSGGGAGGSSASTSNIYSGNIENSVGGKLSYTYASNGNPIGAMYTHPGAVQYGTHLYHPSAKVIEIGGNRVTAGSAAIAGVAPPAYHPQQQSGNSNGAGSGAGSGAVGNGGGSSSVIKFS